MKLFGKEIPKKDIVIVKVIICGGILSIHFLPPHHAMMVNTATNLLWLFRG